MAGINAANSIGNVLVAVSVAIFNLIRIGCASASERWAKMRAGRSKAEMTEPTPDTWQEALTRRLRTLLRTVPLQRMEAGKGRRELALGDQDLRALALRALDLTIERMGLGTGPTYEEIRDALRSLVFTCDAGLAGR